MVPALGEPQVNGAITLEWVRNYGLSRVRETSRRERESLNTGSIPGAGRGAGHRAVNNQVPASRKEPHCSWGEG